jgi:hypothetical protein
MIPPQLIQAGVQVLGSALTTITGAIAAKRAEKTAAAEAQAKMLEEVRNSQIAYNDSVVGAFNTLWNEAQSRMNQADKDYKAYVDRIRAETAASAKADKMGGTRYAVITSISPFEVAYSTKAGAERKQFDGSAVYKDAYNAVYPVFPVNPAAETDIIIQAASQKIIIKNAGTANLFGSVPDKFNTTKGGKLATVNALLGRPEPMTDVPAVGPEGGPKSTNPEPKSGGNYTILIIGAVAAVVIYYMMNKKKK